MFGRIERVQINHKLRELTRRNGNFFDFFFQVICTIKRTINQVLLSLFAIRLEFLTLVCNCSNSISNYTCDFYWTNSFLFLMFYLRFCRFIVKSLNDAKISLLRFFAADLCRFIAVVIKWGIKFMRQHCDCFNDDQFFFFCCSLQLTFFIVISFVPVKVVYAIPLKWNVQKICFTYFRNIHRGKLADRLPNRRHANEPEHMLDTNLGQRQHMFRRIHDMPNRLHPDLENCEADSDSHMYCKRKSNKLKWKSGTQNTKLSC